MDKTQTLLELAAANGGPRLAKVTPGLPEPAPSRRLDERRAEFIKALAEMRNHLHEPDYAVTDLCKALYCSRRTAQRLFSAFETSFTEQLYVMRMRLARKLLLDSKLPIAEIAKRVGYRQAMHFSRAYERYHGILPRDERANAGLPQRINGQSPGRKGG